MTRQVAPGHIGDRHGQNQWNYPVMPRTCLMRRDDRCLGVQRVEDRFDEHHVDAAFDKPIDLIAIHGLHLIEIDLAKARIVDVG